MTELNIRWSSSGDAYQMRARDEHSIEVTVSVPASRRHDAEWRKVEAAMEGLRAALG